MITEFGKILDPVADKLTQGTLAISFSFRYPAMTIVLAVFLCKEGFMAAAGAYMMKRGYRMNGAQMHGKICTAVLDAVMLILLIFPNISVGTVNILAGISIAFMGYSLFHYAKMYWHVWKTQIRGNQVNKKNG